MAAFLHRTRGTGCAAYTWGYNSDGWLGTCTTTDQSTPVQLGTDTHWASVAAGRGNPSTAARRCYGVAREPDRPPLLP